MIMQIGRMSRSILRASCLPQRSRHSAGISRSSFQPPFQACSFSTCHPVPANLESVPTPSLLHCSISLEWLLDECWLDCNRDNAAQKISPGQSRLASECFLRPLYSETNRLPCRCHASQCRRYNDGGNDAANPTMSHRLPQIRIE